MLILNHHGLCRFKWFTDRSGNQNDAQKASKYSFLHKSNRLMFDDIWKSYLPRYCSHSSLSLIDIDIDSVWSELVLLVYHSLE